MPDSSVMVVTGGSSGIGAACARLGLAKGYQVIGLDRGLPGPDCPWQTLVVDVSSTADLERAAREVEAEHGGCDVLVTSAGVAPVGAFEDCSEDEWDLAFDVNVKGTWAACKAFQPLMIGRAGCIVTIASGAGLRPHADLAAYSASKAAVIALTKAMAARLQGTGIRVNCVSPGTIRTPLQEVTSAARLSYAGIGSVVGSARIGVPEDVAEAVLYLVSPAAKFIHGATLPVDGGRVLF